MTITPGRLLKFAESRRANPQNCLSSFSGHVGWSPGPRPSAAGELPYSRAISSADRPEAWKHGLGRMAQVWTFGQADCAGLPRANQLRGSGL